MSRIDARIRFWLAWMRDIVTSLKGPASKIEARVLYLLVLAVFAFSLSSNSDRVSEVSHSNSVRSAQVERVGARASAELKAERANGILRICEEGNEHNRHGVAVFEKLAERQRKGRPLPKAQRKLILEIADAFDPRYNCHLRLDELSQPGTSRSADSSATLPLR